MSFKYHGNWCGPGWSDGRYVSSTRGFAPAVDEFDETCRQHDFALEGGARDRGADAKFYQENFGKGYSRSLAALAVLARDKLETIVETPPLQYNTKMTKSSKTSLRGNKNKTMHMSNPTRNDVTRAAPVAVATRRTGQTPLVQTTSTGVTITHRSFLQPVTNSSTFEAVSIPCNPGLSGSFPWLGKLARRYEQYRFKKLRYEFRSVVGSTQTGVIMMSFDYDAADAAPATKAEQAQTIPNSETNVWMNNDLRVKPDSGWKFIRSGTLTANLDVKTYDMGNMWLSSAYGNNTVGGELYVEYTVELRRPTDGPEVGGRFLADTTAFSAPVNQTNATTDGVAFPFRRTSNTDLEATAGGEYLMVALNNGTGLTSSIAEPTIATASTTSAVSTINNVISATTTARIMRVRVATGDILTFANAGAGTTIGNVRYYVAPIDYGVFD